MTVIYRGSRKHVLDWTGSPSFLTDLAALVSPAPAVFPDDSIVMPRGAAQPREARLETFGPEWTPESPAWPLLRSWWLRHEAGANTPNWDIVASCVIEGRPGLVLVEAKANWPELGIGGKLLSDKASGRSKENHAHIGAAIKEADTGWKLLGPDVSISSTSHYQLANRLAFTWKLATLGIPVVLVYLGFTGDHGIQDAGAPFADHADWQNAFAQYANGTVPKSLFDRRLNVGLSPVWLLSRSLPVTEISPPRSVT